MKNKDTRRGFKLNADDQQLLRECQRLVAEIVGTRTTTTEEIRQALRVRRDQLQAQLDQLNKRGTNE